MQSENIVSQFGVQLLNQQKKQTPPPSPPRTVDEAESPFRVRPREESPAELLVGDDFFEYHFDARQADALEREDLNKVPTFPTVLDNVAPRNTAPLEIAAQIQLGPLVPDKGYETAAVPRISPTVQKSASSLPIGQGKNRKNVHHVL
jgi:hypothetical protein